jgi:hypothetical protein
MPREKENPMRNVRALAVGKILLAARIILIATGIAQAQLDIPTFTGKFTLTTQVLWGNTVLRPGNYTVTIGSSRIPTIALVRDSSGRPVARFISGINDGKTSAGNALLVREKNGQLRVYALALDSMGKLIYDRALAREETLEARTPQTVPVMLAKR